MSLLCSLLVLLQPASCRNTIHTLGKKIWWQFSSSLKAVASLCLLGIAVPSAVRSTLHTWACLGLMATQQGYHHYFLRSETEQESKMSFSQSHFRSVAAPGLEPPLCLTPTCVPVTPLPASVCVRWLSHSVDTVLGRHRKEMDLWATSSPVVSSHPWSFMQRFICCKREHQDEARFDPTCHRPHLTLCCMSQQGKVCTSVHFLISPAPIVSQTPIPENLPAFTCLDHHRLHAVPVVQCKNQGRKVLTENSGQRDLSWRGVLQIDY